MGKNRIGKHAAFASALTATGAAGSFGARHVRLGKKAAALSKKSGRPVQMTIQHSGKTYLKHGAGFAAGTYAAYGGYKLIQGRRRRRA